MYISDVKCLSIKQKSLKVLFWGYVLLKWAANSNLRLILLKMEVKLQFQVMFIGNDLETQVWGYFSRKLTKISFLRLSLLINDVGSSWLFLRAVTRTWPNLLIKPTHSSFIWKINCFNIEHKNWFEKLRIKILKNYISPPPPRSKQAGNGWELEKKRDLMDWDVNLTRWFLIFIIVEALRRQ